MKVSTAAAGTLTQAVRAWAMAICILWVAVPALAQDGDYALGVGDLLKVTVFGHQDLSGEFEVNSGGRINLPLVGEVTVVNENARSVEQKIISFLKPDYLKNPQVSVEIISYRPFYIVGEVANPGSYEYVGGMRVINAVAMAGGFTYRAKQDDLLITRAKGNGKPEPARQETLVYPGDVIKVPERFF